MQLDFQFPADPVVLCIGAHCDDIEIGCGGTVLRLLDAYPNLRMTWLVLTGNAERQAETQTSANSIGGDRIELILHDLRDGFLPYNAAAAKELFQATKASISPHLILCHWEGDRHQDHRLISELTGSTFRSSLIMEYEIPKYDGDLGRPNMYVPLSRQILDRKIDNIIRSYRTQHGKQWFDADTFLALHRLRGIECGNNTRYAEAFYSRKAILAG